MAPTGRGPSGAKPGRRSAGPGARTGARKAPARSGAAASGRPGAGPGRSRATAAGAIRKAGAAQVSQERRAARGVMRVVVLASILVLLTVTLVPTLRSYLRQQGEIEGLRQKVAAQRADVEELQKEQARWNDDDYVMQQARERLKFVKVGEKSYTVIDGKPAKTKDTKVAAAPPSASDQPWYGQLWQSMRAADTAPSTASGAAAEK